MRQTKFVKGARIWFLAEACAAMEGGRWLYFRDKPLHPGFMMGWTVRSVAGYVKAGYLHYAELRRETWEDRLANQLDEDPEDFTDREAEEAP